MKQKIRLTVVALIAFVTTSLAQTKPAPWAELKNFHHFMSASFHPAEEGNFEPLKQKADSMLTAAKQWLTAPVPAEYKPSETKKALKQLVKECDGIKRAVASNASDADLLKKITAAHDVFHTIVKECKKEEETH
jgi:hypothetical protein